MSYTKQFNDFSILTEVDHGRIWMQISKQCNNCSSSQHTAYKFISSPNFIERLFGITWQDKLERGEKALLRILLKRTHDNSHVIQTEIDKFLKVKGH